MTGRIRLVIREDGHSNFSLNYKGLPSDSQIRLLDPSGKLLSSQQVTGEGTLTLGLPGKIGVYTVEALVQAIASSQSAQLRSASLNATVSVDLSSAK